MKLADALNTSEIEVAELWTDGKMVVVGSDDENGGYEISFKIGDMPPYASEHAANVEEAEQIVASAAIPYEYGSEEWEPREGE